MKDLWGDFLSDTVFTQKFSNVKEKEKPVLIARERRAKPHEEKEKDQSNHGNA